MNWFALSCVTALTQAVKDTFLKKSLRGMDATTAMIGYCLSVSVFLWLTVAAGPPVSLSGPFWTCLLVGGGLGGVTYWLYGLALKAGDLSLTLPMLAFTPLFLLVTSPVTVGEFPEPGGLCGIALVVSGAYVLNLRERRFGFWGPVKALLTHKGSRLMLAVAAIWSVGANIDKLGLTASSPLFWGASVYSATTLALLAPRLLRRGGASRLPGLPPWPVGVAGLLEGIGIVCQMYALPMTQVAYVIAVKRLSIVFGVLLGAAVFREPDLRHRLPGALLMVAGVFFIAVFG